MKRSAANRNRELEGVVGAREPRWNQVVAGRLSLVALPTDRWPPYAILAGL